MKEPRCLSWLGLRALLSKRRKWAELVEEMESRPLVSVGQLERAMVAVLTRPCVCASCGATVEARDLRPVALTPAGAVLHCSLCRVESEEAA